MRPPRPTPSIDAVCDWAYALPERDARRILASVASYVMCWPDQPADGTVDALVRGVLIRAGAPVVATAPTPQVLP